VHLQEIFQLNDTIVSQVTSGGVSGVSIIRLSGSRSVPIVATILEKGINSIPLPGHFSLQTLLINKRKVDKALILHFKAPRSLTGEDVIEIQLHGNPSLVSFVLKTLYTQGARQAKAGEFLQRAYRNEKYTLAEIESLGALLQANSQSSLQLSSLESQDLFEKKLHSLSKQIIDLWMKTEAYFDFSDEEDVQDSLDLSFQSDLHYIDKQFNELLQIAEQSQYLKQNSMLALLGPPNVGKSSLLNLLAHQELAIVSDIAGTTRDSIIGKISVQGHVFEVTDTAGLRTTKCQVEKEGIKRTENKAQQASCILYLQSADCYEQLEPKRVEFLSRLSVPIIEVINKVDLYQKKEKLLPEIRNCFSERIFISVKKQEGIKDLKAIILEKMGLVPLDTLPFAIYERQKNLLEKAYQFFILARNDKDIIEVSIDHLKRANDCLGEIFGECRTDDMLGKIFQSFCIGK
jgi:tRNA modification GTPase